MKRLCREPGCPDLGDSKLRNWCRAHYRTTSQRGYGRGHQEIRAEMVARLPLPCWYCGELIESARDLVAAHEIDGDDRSPRQPAHGICNERAKHGGRTSQGGGEGLTRVMALFSPDPPARNAVCANLGLLGSLG